MNLWEYSSVKKRKKYVVNNGNFLHLMDKKPFFVISVKIYYD